MTAAPFGARRLTTLQIPPKRLLLLNRLEQGLEVPLPKAPRALSLDHLVKQRRAILHGLRKDLEQVSIGITIDKNTELLELIDWLIDLPHATLQLLVVRRRRTQELHAMIAQRAHRGDDVVGRECEVLHARPAIELEVLVDLRFLLALRRLVDRKL